MSGHSKWATTKRQKEATDSKRSGLFTKLSRNITVAAREGADPKANFKLRIAVDKARSFSMPKENIERAIARGSGSAGGAVLESALYEGFGPGGCAVMVDVVTDNKNRAVSELKHAFNDSGGSFGASVAWMFALRGTIRLKETSLKESQELTLIDAGVADIRTDDQGITLVTSTEDLQTLKETAEKFGLTVTEAGPAYLAKDLVQPGKPDAVVRFLDALNELDDVQNVYTNADV